MKKILLFTIMLAAGLSSVHAADLQVNAELAVEKGALFYALFDQEGFLQKPIATATSEPGQPGAVFRNLAPGKYAVCVFQDMNGNGALDKNIAGAPIEPIGFSNDAKGNMGPPSFEAAAIQFGEQNQSTTIKLH